jgi:hypothetical protein
MISLELFLKIILILLSALILLFLFFVIISFVIRDNPKINKIKKELQTILFDIRILSPLFSLFFIIKSFISFVTRHDDKKLSDINKIIKEVEISEKQKIGNLKYTSILTLEQKNKIFEKFLNSDLITTSNISRIEMEDVFEGEIESVPFISADLFLYKEVRGREHLSLLGTYYYFDIPTIERDVNIVLVPRIHFVTLIFLMLFYLWLLWYGIDKKDIEAILVSIIFIPLLLIAYYFEGSKTESIKFNSYFVLETNDEIKARKILTPAVIQSIINLREKEGAIMIAIKEGQLHVVIKNKDRFEYKFNYFLSYILSFVYNSRDDLTKMKENIAQEVRQEIDLIKRLLESIRLKETLYKKGSLMNNTRDDLTKIKEKGVMENKKGIMKNKKRITKNKKG